MAAGEPPQPRTPLDYAVENMRGEIVGKCTACGGQLELGVMVDHAHMNQPSELTWFAGDWRSTWWSDFNVPKNARQFAVRAARCVKCARLELYAPEPFAQ
jgi:hypothetical protein